MRRKRTISPPPALWKSSRSSSVNQMFSGKVFGQTSRVSGCLKITEQIDILVAVNPIRNSANALLPYASFALRGPAVLLGVEGANAGRKVRAAAPKEANE